MSQFILVRSVIGVHLPPGIRAEAPSDDSLVVAVMDAYGFDAAHCRLLVDPSRGAESLTDDIAAAWQAGDDITSTPFGQLARELVEKGVELICWCGDGFRELPRARTWGELISELRGQLGGGPADVWLWFQPELT